MWEKLWEQLSKALINLFKFLFSKFKNSAPNDSDSKKVNLHSNAVPSSFDGFENENKKGKSLSPYLSQNEHSAVNLNGSTSARARSKF